MQADGIPAGSVKGIRAQFDGGQNSGPKGAVGRQNSAPKGAVGRQNSAPKGAVGGQNSGPKVQVPKPVAARSRAQSEGPNPQGSGRVHNLSPEISSQKGGAVPRSASGDFSQGVGTLQSEKGYGGSASSRGGPSSQCSESREEKSREETKRHVWRNTAAPLQSPQPQGAVDSGVSEASGIRRVSSERSLRESRSHRHDTTGLSRTVNFDTVANPTAHENAVELASTLFEVPVKPLSVSGGTAAFYRVMYRADAIPPGTLPNRYVGKDVARAKDEVAFYSTIKELVDEDGSWSDLAKMMCESPGVVVLPCSKPGQEGPTNMNLLLLENMFARFNKMRLCDIKLGEETAIAHWKGKSWLGSVTNSMVDQRTNSRIEGLRLEGMDNASQAVETRLNATVDDSKASTSYMTKNLLGEKAIKKIVLQRFAARDILTYWLDLSSLGEGYETRTHDSIAQVLEEFTQCIRVLAQVPWPQPWIGSSLGLGMEASADVYDWDRLVMVRLFDWGRADLYRQKDYESLTREERRMFILRWRGYMRAMCRVHWETARIFAHRCCCNFWESLVFEVAAERTVLVSDLMKVATTHAALRTIHTLAAALMPLQDNEYLEDEGVEVRLPLTCSKDPLCAIKGPGEGIGFIHAHIQISNSGNGTMTTIVTLGRCVLKEHAVENLSSHMVTIRVLAFEHASDARQHTDALNKGKPEPLPVGYCIDQTTVHGNAEAHAFNFSSRFEFVSYPTEATDEVKKLLEKNTPSSPSSESRSWPELLPPPFLASEKHREMPNSWFSQLCPWVSLPGGCRPEWKLKPMYVVGQDVEKLDAGSGAWLPAMILASDLVVVTYGGGDGTSMTKALPSDHHHIRPKDPTVPLYVDGDDIEVWSSSQNRWIPGVVTEDDAVIVTYHGTNGDRTKRIPALSDKLRPLSGNGNHYSSLYGRDKLNEVAYKQAAPTDKRGYLSPMRRLSDFLKDGGDLADLLGEEESPRPKSPSRSASQPTLSNTSPPAKAAAKKAPGGAKKSWQAIGSQSIQGTQGTQATRGQATGPKPQPKMPASKSMGALPAAAVAASKFLKSAKNEAEAGPKAGMAKPKAPGAKASAPPAKPRTDAPPSPKQGATPPRPSGAPTWSSVTGRSPKSQAKAKPKAQGKQAANKPQLRPLVSDIEDLDDDSDGQ